MKFAYRTNNNAKAISAFWGKSINGDIPYNIKALSEDEIELFVFDALGWPFNDINAIIRDLAEIKSENLLVRLNSPGGDPIDTFAFYHALKNHSAKVTVRIEALAASAASFLALAGDEVQSYSSSLMMIHNSYILTIGNRFELIESADILEKIDNNMRDIYIAKTKIGKREMSELMKAETWFTAKEAKEKGFIDTILEAGKPAKAQFDLSIFANIPADITDIEIVNQGPTIRDGEKALREVGFSQNTAKAMLAGSAQAKSNQEEIETLKTVVSNLETKEVLRKMTSNLGGISHG